MVEIISKDDDGNVNIIVFLFVFAEVSPMLFLQMLGWIYQLIEMDKSATLLVRARVQLFR